ncbi:hypothetical protein WME88_56100 [Sorangium sp. So ce216]
MSTQRMSSRTSTFKLTIAVGLGLLGAAGVAPMRGGSTADPFAIREARAQELGGLGGRPIGGSGFTWGNGITAEQFRKYGTLLCANDDLKLGGGLLRDQSHAASPAFAKHMQEPGFRNWFSYLVRDGAPFGAEVSGGIISGLNGAGPILFKGKGGLTFNWLNTPLPAEKRSVVLGALSAFANDNGPTTIVRVCNSCSGIDGVIARPGPVSMNSPKIKRTNEKKDWLLELAFVGECTASPKPNIPRAPKVHIFWSEQLKKAMNERANIGAHIQERMCTRAYDEQNAGSSPCPFHVVDSMEKSCKMKEDKGMTCQVSGSDRDATYTFIDPSVTWDEYRLPILWLQPEKLTDLPRPRPDAQITVNPQTQITVNPQTQITVNPQKKR